MYELAKKLNEFSNERKGKEFSFLYSQYIIIIEKCFKLAMHGDFEYRWLIDETYSKDFVNHLVALLEKDGLFVFQESVDLIKISWKR